MDEVTKEMELMDYGLLAKKSHCLLHVVLFIWQNMRSDSVGVVPECFDGLVLNGTNNA